MLAVNKNKTTRKSFERQITQFKSMKFVNALSKAKQLYVDNGLDEGNELNMLKEAKVLSSSQYDQQDPSKNKHKQLLINQINLTVTDSIIQTSPAMPKRSVNRVVETDSW